MIPNLSASGPIKSLNKMIPRKLIFGRCLLVLAGVLVGLLMAEVGMRLGSISAELQRNQLWSPLTYQASDWRQRKREYNDRYIYHPLLGYVRRSVLEQMKTEKRDDRRLRILFLGDSISEQGTYVNRLDNLLIKHFPEHDIKIINTGITSYDTTIERRLLEHFGIKISPDLIILQLCLNDFLSTPLITLDDDGQWVAFASRGFDRWINLSLFRRSFLYRYFAIKLLSTVNKEAPSSQDNRLRRELRQISLLAAKHEIPLRIILFPYLVADLENFPRLKRMRRIIKQLGLMNHTLDLTTEYKCIPHQKLQRDAGDFVHPSLLGDEIAARALMSFSRPLITRLLQDKPKTAHRSIVPADFIRSDPPRGFETTGLDRVERLKHSTWRWAMGPKMIIRFHSTGPRGLQLRFKLQNPISHQRLHLMINGRVVQQIGPLAAWTKHRDLIPFEAQTGSNEITLSFDRWNGPQHSFASSDSRPMAVELQELKIEAQSLR